MRTEVMEVLLSFIIKNIEGYADRKIQKDFPEDMLFIDVLREILKIINSNITLDKIAVISAVKGLFFYDDIRKSVKDIVGMHLLEFTITKRDLVNGSNLMLKEVISTSEEDSSKEMQFGYVKPKTESETKGVKRDELVGELHISEMEKVKRTRIEMDNAKEAIDRMEEMLRKPSEEDHVLEPIKKSQEKEKVLPPPPSSTPKFPLNQNIEVTEDLKKLFSKAMERKKGEPPVEPPSGPPAGFPAPKSAPSPPPGSGAHPSTLRGAATEEMKSLFKIKEEKKPEPPASAPTSGSATPPPTPARSHALEKSSIREPTPHPPPPPPSKPVDTSTGYGSFSFRTKKKVKKMGASLRSFADEVEEVAPILDDDIKDDGIVDDFKGDSEEISEVEEKKEEILGGFAETEAPTELFPSLKFAMLSELDGLAKKIGTSKEYQKNIAIEYFDKMNPKKYYPLIIDISDIEQATTISEENIMTGERKVQVKEKMAVVLKSSIVKVKPMFPGCSIVPEERYTDFDMKEDKLTFYVTPLVDDEIEDGRIEFIDSEGNIFHSAPTPTKVEDPRFARIIALYGGLASFLPKILETLGFSFTQETQMATLLPFLQNVLGDMNLSNFIGISGILITIIICIITVAVRKPNSVKKKFKVARVGRLKSAVKAQK